MPDYCCSFEDKAELSGAKGLYLFLLALPALKRWCSWGFTQIQKRCFWKRTRNKCCHNQWRRAHFWTLSRFPTLMGQVLVLEPPGNWNLRAAGRREFQKCMQMRSVRKKTVLGMLTVLLLKRSSASTSMGFALRCTAASNRPSWLVSRGYREVSRLVATGKGSLV